MKKFIVNLFLGLGVFAFYPSFAQTLSERIATAEVIYVAPLQYYNYYGLKLGPGLWTKPYKFDGDFSVGDIVSTIDPNISIEIVGKVPEETLTSVYDNLIKQLQDKWGADKVKPWPKEVVNKTMGTFDQKSIDCKIYVIMQRAAWQDPLMLTKVSSDKPQIKGGNENITLAIYEKTKVGKKGKKQAKVMKSAFEGLNVEFDNVDDHKDAGAEFSQLANENLQPTVDALIEDFLAEIEKL